MKKPPSAPEQRTERRHRVILLVSSVDRRIVPALYFLSRLTPADAIALHVSVDSVETRRLARDWMQVGLSWLPLHVHDCEDSTLSDALRRAVIEEAELFPQTTVVVPELDLCRWWYGLLHRSNARRIAQQLQSLRGIATVIVPYAPTLRSPAPASAAAHLRFGGREPA